MQHREVKAETVAEGLLALLGSHGVDYLFANAGTDFPPIIEAYSRASRSGLSLPKAIAVGHENAAVAMAHGYWMITGRPQAVMVHVNVGTANALCALLNAWRENVPLLLMAGRTPIYEQGVFGARNGVIHWGQEMRDQAAMLRECVKWDYELRGGAQLEAVVGRALTLATAEPGGPVYLTLPREVIAAAMTGTVNLAQGAAPPSAAHPDPEAIARAAEIIAGAQNPLIIANRAGRDPGIVDILSRFADRFAVPVVEFWANYMSFPGDHPMHLGFETEPWIGKADAILVLDTVVPWIPDQAAPREDCPIIQIGPDPSFADFPMRGFPTTVGITSNVGAALVALGDRLGGLIGDKDESSATAASASARSMTTDAPGFAT